MLIVEDEESGWRDPLAFLLHKEGFEVTVAGDGPSALAEFDRSGADIVLLDLMLPRHDPAPTCKALRTRSGIPVIAVTAWQDRQGRGSGAPAPATTSPSRTPPANSSRESGQSCVVGPTPTSTRSPATPSSRSRTGPDGCRAPHRDGRRRAVTLPLKEFDLLGALAENSAGCSRAVN